MIDKIFRNKISGNIFRIISEHESGWCKGQTLQEVKGKLQDKMGDKVHIHRDVLETMCEEIQNGT